MMVNKDKKFLYENLTDKIIGCSYKVYNKLGAGFLEKVYENALVIELRKEGLEVEQQVAINVCYEGQTVGDYIADLVVESKVIIEIKAVSTINRAHETQLVNYLKATDKKVGLLINFGDVIIIKRKVLQQERNNYK